MLTSVAAVRAPRRGPRHRLLNAMEYPLRYLFGDDVFVSYSRVDGIIYAEGLAAELAKRGLSCRVDLWQTVPGAELPGSLRRALRWSKMLVLVATRGAAASLHVRDELAEFVSTPGVVVPIGFAAPLEEARWWPQVHGLPISYETAADALTKGKPSQTVLSRIENSITFRRRTRRIRDLAATALLVLVALIGLSLFAAKRAAAGLAEAKTQREEAARQQRLAGEATKQRLDS